jgi:hypothetical protein
LHAMLLEIVPTVSYWKGVCTCELNKHIFSCFHLMSKFLYNNIYFHQLFPKRGIFISFIRARVCIFYYIIFECFILYAYIVI